MLPASTSFLSEFADMFVELRDSPFLAEGCIPDGSFASSRRPYRDSKGLSVLVIVVRVQQALLASAPTLGVTPPHHRANSSSSMFLVKQSGP